MNRIIAADPETLAVRMADRWCAFSREVLTYKDRFQVALSGGSTPRTLYRALASPPFRERLDWARHEFFFGDERPVPPNHPDSNGRMADEALFSRAPVAPDRHHRMMGEFSDLDAAARAYEEILLQRLPVSSEGIPIFDLILLGLGKDGHTASLFPHTTALGERTRAVVVNEVPVLQTRRLTITYPVINRARQVWIMATGSDKAPVLSRVWSLVSRDPRTIDDLPILGVSPAALVWWVDAAAAQWQGPVVSP